MTLWMYLSVCRYLRISGILVELCFLHIYLSGPGPGLCTWTVEPNIRSRPHWGFSLGGALRPHLLINLIMVAENTPLLSSTTSTDRMQPAHRRSRLTAWWMSGGQRQRYHPTLLVATVLALPLFLVGYLIMHKAVAVPLLAVYGSSVAVVASLFHLAPTWLFTNDGGERRSRLYDILCPGSYEHAGGGKWHIKGDSKSGDLSAHVIPPRVILIAIINFALCTCLPSFEIVVGHNLATCKSNESYPDAGHGVATRCAMQASGDAAWQETMFNDYQCDFMMDVDNINQTNPLVMKQKSVCFQDWYKSGSTFVKLGCVCCAIIVDGSGPGY